MIYYNNFVVGKNADARIKILYAYALFLLGLGP